MKNANGGVMPLRVAAVLAVVFGVLTIKQGGAVLFGDGAEREAAGNYVPFVLWFNFLAGFVYVVAGVGLWRRQRWAGGVAFLLAATTLLVFAALGVHVAGGGAYEVRTVVAMILRSSIWLVISAIAYRYVWHRP